MPTVLVSLVCHFTTMCVARLYGIKWAYDGWILKAMEGDNHGLNWHIILALAQRVRKTMKKPQGKYAKNCYATCIFLLKARKTTIFYFCIWKVKAHTQLCSMSIWNTSWVCISCQHKAEENTLYKLDVKNRPRRWLKSLSDKWGRCY
jgi:hypothetical protein